MIRLIWNAHVELVCFHIIKIISWTQTNDVLVWGNKAEHLHP